MSEWSKPSKVAFETVVCLLPRKVVVNGGRHCIVRNHTGIGKQRKGKQRKVEERKGKKR